MALDLDGSGLPISHSKVLSLDCKSDEQQKMLLLISYSYEYFFDVSVAGCSLLFAPALPGTLLLLFFARSLMSFFSVTFAGGEQSTLTVVSLELALM